MAAAEGGSTSTDEAARYLGFSKQSVLNLYHAGKLLAWPSAIERASKAISKTLLGALTGTEAAVDWLHANKASLC